MVLKALMAVAALSLGAGAAHAQTPGGKSIDALAGANANKRLVLTYLDMAFTQGRRDEARALYFAPEFKNHPEERPPTANPNSPIRPGLKITYEFQQAIAEGDWVVVHSMVRGFGIGEPVPGPFSSGGKKVGDDVVDIFKVQNGKIVGKSDTVQASDSEELFIP